jgi:hypothetical protein
MFYYPASSSFNVDGSILAARKLPKSKPSYWRSWMHTELGDPVPTSEGSFFTPRVFTPDSMLSYFRYCLLLSLLYSIVCCNQSLNFENASHGSGGVEAFRRRLPAVLMAGLAAFCPI